MVNKILRILEEHAEKIVLAIVGVICMYFLLSRVVFSPNTVEYDGQKFSPGAVDRYISDQADELANMMSASSESLPAPKSRLPEFLAKLDSSISEIDSSLWPVVPQIPSSGAGGTRTYPIPDIGIVTEPQIEYFRGVAYVPTQEITPENTYAQNSGHEPNDLDLVTMQAKFNFARLRQEYFEAYAGDDVPMNWRDPCYAQPVFAAVDLQRQRLNEDGTWDEWVDVPRTQIDHRRALFTIIEKLSDLPPGGLEVRMLQYKDKDTQIELLQPTAYQIASAKEEWFPPLLHRKFLKIQAAEDLEERRKEMEDRQNAANTSTGRTSTSGRTDSRRTSTTSSRTRSGGGAEYGGTAGTTSRTRSRRTTDSGADGLGLYGDTGTGSRRRRGDRGATDDVDLMMEQGLYMQGAGQLSNKPSINDVYDDLYEIELRPDTDFSKLDEITFWAHDDSLEPRNTYRYRMRLGVFNPSPGPDSEQVILWSDFSEITDPIHVPGRMYFFATDTQDAETAVRVQVSKYVLGYWYSDYFKVASGEVIGDLRELETKTRGLTSRTGPGALGRPGFGPSLDSTGLGSSLRSQSRDVVTEPDEIDYNTGAILVDISTVDDWAVGTKMAPRQYKDMLYSYDAENIEHMGIGQKFWTAELRTAFGDIVRAQRQPKEPLKAWDSNRQRRRPAGILDYGDGEISPEMYEQMMMMEGMGNN